jgi:hypothetical protein
MTSSGGGSVRGIARAAALASSTCLLGCALMPRELNLTPLWFHRLDEHGDVLEWDALWPILHYERTPAGGDDFRVRPLYRRVTEPENDAVEHQFLWPFGRVRSDREEASSRLFPLWSWRRHVNQDGQWDIDWYALFPFFWGGANERGDENYFAFLPFYADFPQFLTYDRFQTILFPLWVRLDKDGHRHTLVLWPLIGWSNCAQGQHDWWRVIPFYGQDVEAGEYSRHFALFPFISWSVENEFTDDPVTSFFLFPLFGFRSGRATSGLTILWPMFAYTTKEDSFTRWNVLWPFFYYYHSDTDVELHVTQWWFWPFIGHAESDCIDTWSALWPIIWWRDYNDPEARTSQQWVLPFFWHVHQMQKEDGATEDYVKVWPLGHRTVKRDVEGRRVGGDWSILSPIPWRDGNATGIEENYGFLWELAVGRQRAADDRGYDVLGRVFTRRTRQGTTTWSVPFLFNYESGEDGKTLRLFQFLPIPFGGGERTQ